MKRLAGLAFLLMATTLFAETAPDFSRFQPMTFREFERLPETRQVPVRKRSMVLDLEAHPYALTVSYTGRKRSLPKTHQRFMISFGKSIQQTEFVARYEHEVDVIQGGRHYWMPIQKQVLPHLEREMTKGNPLVAYARYLGTAGKDRIFAMVDFVSAVDKSLTRR